MRLRAVLIRSLLIATVVVSVLGVRTMSAWAGQAGGYCEGSQDVAAINQYCEDIPGSTGAAPLSSRTRPLAAALPPAVVRALSAPSRDAATVRHRSELLTLPAPSRVPISSAHAAPTKAATRSADSPLLFVAIGIAVLMAVIAAVTRRRSV